MKIKGLDRYSVEEEAWMPLLGPDGNPFVSTDKAGKEHQGELLLRSIRHKQVKKAAISFSNKNSKFMNKAVLTEAQEKSGKQKTEQFVLKHLLVDTRGFVDSNTEEMIPEGKGGEAFGKSLVKFDWVVEQVFEFVAERASFTEVSEEDEPSEAKKP